MEQRMTELVERLELLEPKKGMGPFLERNFGPIMTILILSIGFVAQWVSTKDYLQNVDARVKVLEQTYVPKNVHDAKDAMREQQFTEMNRRLDGIDGKLDMMLYARSQQRIQPPGGN